MKMLMSLLLLLCPLAALASLPQVNFTFASRDIIEGQEVTVTAELSALTSNGVLVPFTVSGSANSDDHDLIPGTIYISPNHKRGSITFRVFEDEISEGSESIVVSMLAPANANLGSIRTHTIYIHDAEEDNLPIVNFSATSSNNHEGELVFVEATLSSPSSQIVIVPFVVGGSAQFPGDHNLISGNLTFFPGSTTATLSVLINEDGENEDDETIAIQLNAPVVNATLGSNTAHIITIKAPTIVQPNVDFSINLENGGFIPFYAHFDASSSYVPGHENEADRGITSCTWSLSGGNTGDRNFIVPGCQYNPTITIKGNYSLTLTVTGIGGGLATITKNFQALENLIPVANFTVNPESGNAPLNVTLNAETSQDPDGGAIVEYQWNFGNGETLNTASPVVNHTFNAGGDFLIKLIVKDNEGTLSSPKTFNLVVSSPTLLGKVSGITLIDNIGPYTNVSLELKFTSTNQTFNTNSDSFGKFSFEQLPLSGDFVINSQTGDNYKAKATGNLSQANTAEEAAMIYKKIGVGKVSGNVLLINGNIPADGAIVGLKFTSDDQVVYTTADLNGHFTFEDLPLNGNFWLSSFHPSSGSRRNIFAFIDSSTPEQNNLLIMQITPTSVPSFTNGSFELGDFSNWFTIGDNVLVPQGEAFDSGSTGDKFFTKSFTNTSGIPLTDFANSRFMHNASRRTNLKSNRLLQTSLPNNLKTLPCENSIHSAISSNAGVLGSQLSQEITIDPDAETLIGRIKLLTNESLESASEGYNDDFVALLINQIKPNFILLKDVKSVTWGPGKFGYLFSSNEIPFAINVKNLAGLRATLAFGVIDKGDDRGDSAIIVSNLQFLKTSDRNFVENGVFMGDVSFSRNVGAVSWFKVKNTKEMSVINLDQKNFYVLKNNEEVDIPSVKFGNEPMGQTFVFDELLSTDIFSFSMDSTWVSGMPTSACLVGGSK